MRPSNKPEDPDAPSLALRLGARADLVRRLWNGSAGRTVRCVPTRRTLVAECDGGRLFAKWRRGARADAAAEWRWLHELPLLGWRVPEPIAWLGRGRRSLLITAGLSGRALDAWAHDALRDGWLPELVHWACRRVAPQVRALHDAGLVYRDLYWNHVFAADPRTDAAPHFLDVERVFRPRWRRRRWWVKDLAGLWSSAPAAVPARAALRFLRVWAGGSLRGQCVLVREIAAKAARIRAHRPRFG